MTNDEVQEIIDGAEDEYDRLKDRVHDLYDENKVLKKEIERLNNITNELEQELIKKLEAVKTIKNTLGEGAYVVNPHIDILEQEYNYFYKKLQELKGSDKE